MRLTGAVIMLLLLWLQPAQAQTNWGQTYVNAMKRYNEKDWDNAIALFKTAIKINPEKRIVYPRLLMAHLLKTNTYTDSQFNSYMQGEIDFLSALIAKQPRFSIYYSARSSYYIETHNYPNALNDMNAAISYAPQDSLFYLKRGIIYQQYFTGKDELALADYKKAIALHCNDTAMYYNMDKIYRKTKEKYSLAAVLSELVELTGRKEAVPLKLLAKAYDDADNAVVAGMYYERAYKIDQLPETYALVNAMAQKAAANVKANGATIPKPGEESGAIIINSGAGTAAANNTNNKSAALAPKVTVNSTCGLCGGMGKVQKYGTHLAYVPVLDNQGRKLYNNYQTVTEFYYETCSRCGGSGKQR